MCRLWILNRPGPHISSKGAAGRMRSQGVELAVFGLIQQDLAREYKLRQAVWVAEIDFERLLDFPLRSRKFQPISKFPAVERDFSLVLPDDLPYARLSSAIAGLALEEIRGFRPVDRFRGGAISRPALQPIVAGHFSEPNSHLDQRRGWRIEPTLTDGAARAGSAAAGLGIVDCRFSIGDCRSSILSTPQGILR